MFAAIGFDFDFRAFRDDVSSHVQAVGFVFVDPDDFHFSGLLALGIGHIGNRGFAQLGFGGLSSSCGDQHLAGVGHRGRSEVSALGVEAFGLAVYAIA